LKSQKIYKKYKKQVKFTGSLRVAGIFTFWNQINKNNLKIFSIANLWNL